MIGHRGASAAFAENTPEAFAAADRMGADGVELDVRLAPTVAGRQRLVVFHDPLPADPAAVAALPGFDEVLDACGDRLLVNVEIKNSVGDGGHDATMAVVPRVLDSMRRRGVAWRDRFVVSSFDAATLAHCRRVAPEFWTAQLLDGATDGDIERAAAAGHVAIHPRHDAATAAVIESAHAAGLAVNVWTANEASRLVELDGLGVDGACTDVPDVALGALGRTSAALTPRWSTTPVA
ncbi:MAG: glycerophosphodiester phosphodiesterase [Actinomycetota bacterium]